MVKYVFDYFGMETFSNVNKEQERGHAELVVCVCVCD